MSVAPGLEPTPGAGSGFSINLPGVNGATSNLSGLVSSGCGVASDLSSQVVNPSAFGGIGSSVADANCSMQDQLTSGLNQTMSLLDNLNSNVQASAVGYCDLDSAIANGYGGLGSANTDGTFLENPSPGFVPGTDQGTNWLNVGSNAVNIAGAGQAGLSGMGTVSTDASAALRAGSSWGGQVMSALSSSPTLQQLAALGRSPAVTVGGYGLLGVGAGLTGLNVYNQTGNLGQAATDAVGDTALSWGATTEGVEAGAGLGFIIGGPPGALIGGGVGGVIGAGVGIFAGKGFNDMTSYLFSP